MIIFYFRISHKLILVNNNIYINFMQRFFFIHNLSIFAHRTLFANGTHKSIQLNQFQTYTPNVQKLFIKCLYKTYLSRSLLSTLIYSNFTVIYYLIDELQWRRNINHFKQHHLVTSTLKLFLKYL